MTKKHFIKIAAEFKNNYLNAASDEARAAIKSTVEGFCSVAISSNPRFDKSRFLAACGVK
jgi:hypothetical protein